MSGEHTGRVFSDARAAAQQLGRRRLAHDRKRDASPKLPLFRIWSNKHRAWWRPCGYGYTTDRLEAGLFTLSDAVMVCRAAFVGCRDGCPPEMMFPVEDEQPPDIGSK